MIYGGSVNNNHATITAAGAQIPTAFDRTVAAFEGAGCAPLKLSPGQWRGTCPLCGHSRTLIITDSAPRAVIHCFSCHAGTDTATGAHLAITTMILAQVDLTLADLGIIGTPVKAHHRAWLKHWLDSAARVEWPARRRASIMRIVEAFASLSEQSGSPAVFATYPTLEKRSGRTHDTVERRLPSILSAGLVRQLAPTRRIITEAEDGTPRYSISPARWVLCAPVKWANCVDKQGFSLGTDGIRNGVPPTQTAHFIPPAARYSDSVPGDVAHGLQPGRALDRDVFGGTLLETCRAWAVQGGGALTVAQLVQLTGRDPKTLRGHLERLQRIAGPRGPLAICVSPGSRGRGHAARYRLDCRAIASLIATSR